mmetsp:Transcript_12422/g.38242  ORF Transcript_12422/g.38242 Transcript_12422/m.38242 type:complete len:468 (+) Transcript_12422:1556-2959(+)
MGAGASAAPPPPRPDADCSLDEVAGIRARLEDALGALEAAPDSSVVETYARCLAKSMKRPPKDHQRVSDPSEWHPNRRPPPDYVEENRRAAGERRPRPQKRAWRATSKHAPVPSKTPPRPRARMPTAPPPPPPPPVELSEEDRRLQMLAALSSPERRDRAGRSRLNAAGATGDVAKLLEEKDLQIKMLITQLEGAGISAVSEVVPLEEAKLRLQAALATLSGAGRERAKASARELAAAERDLEKWDAFAAGRSWNCLQAAFLPCAARRGRASEHPPRTLAESVTARRFIAHHPDEIETKRAAAAAWWDAQRPACADAQRAQKAFVPPDVLTAGAGRAEILPVGPGFALSCMRTTPVGLGFCSVLREDDASIPTLQRRPTTVSVSARSPAGTSRAELEMAGLAPALAARVYVTKALWLLRATDEFVARVHDADLRSKFAVDRPSGTAGPDFATAFETPACRRCNLLRS